MWLYGAWLVKANLMIDQTSVFTKIRVQNRLAVGDAGTDH